MIISKEINKRIDNQKYPSSGLENHVNYKPVQHLKLSGDAK